MAQPQKNDEDMNNYIENDCSVPNKLPNSISELILKKSLLSSCNHNFSPKTTHSVPSFEKNSDFVTENQKVSFSLKTSAFGQTAETKVKKKFSSDYFQERNRPGLPTLTQKKRDLAPLLEVEGLENISFKDSDGGNLEEVSLQINKSEENKKNYILNELENIERLKLYKMKIEKFVMLFNSKPQEGINYLKENKITSSEEIAHKLLTFEGLSKEVLGQYFGSPDAYNQEIFSQFCSMLDFSKQELDQALRLLLTRFKLPGEAQQIDRIVQTFSKQYMIDNPQAFNDEDTPYILSYSAIMLSTDAHSSTIPQKNKMKKHQFVENNKRICPSITNEYLEGMFDRIVSQKFETKSDCFHNQIKRL